jgi:hypothetical protein
LVGKGKTENLIKNNEPIYFGDKQLSVDYIVRNNDGKLTIKEEWY